MSKIISKVTAKKNTKVTYSVYIPKDLEDCFGNMKIILDSKDIARGKAMDESDFLAMIHHGFGQWIRNNWGLWKGSVLSEYFNGMGIAHPDDMSSIILISWHRKMNGKRLKVKAQVKYYQAYWKKEDAATAARLKKKEEQCGHSLKGDPGSLSE
jgi:hypothetical protein